MTYRKRIYYSESQKAQMWERWQQGESLQQIAQLFDRNHSSVQRILAETGGIQPRRRRRSAQTLSWLSARRFRAAWPEAIRYEPWLTGLGVRLRLSVES